MKGLSILHLEDDDMDAELIAHALESGGVACRIARVQTRDEFSHALETDGFDLILADYKLPSFDGFSALRLAREIRPDVPFIFVSGNIGEEVAVESLKEGATDYVLKDRLSRLAPAAKRALREADERRARTRAEEEARELNEKLQSLVEEALVGVYIIQDSAYVYFNQRFAEILGYTKQELDVIDLMETVHPDDVGRVRKNLEGLLEGRAKTVRYEYRCLRKDGSRCHIEALGSHALYEGKPSIIGTAMDITDRKVLEQQRADMYAMVTHDLKSPLTTILGYSELLLEAKADRLDQDIQKMVGGIRDGGYKLLHMVEDFLTISRLESGLLAVNATPVDISWTLTEAGHSVQAAIDLKGLTFEVKVQDALTEVVLDHKLVQRAVLNLLENAVNYTPGGGRITLEARSADGEAGRSVVISVTDTGAGIPLSLQGRVFDKYFRAPHTAGIKGTGLGLAIVKAVAEAHKGRVELESEPGKGSTFRLIIPVQSKT